MRVLNRHIGLTILSATLLVLLIITGLQIFISFITELEDIGSGHYTLFQAVQYVIYTLPSGIYGFFPVIGLMGSLTGLGYLASHSELMVMQTSGVSRLQVSWAVLRVAILCSLVMMLIGEGIGPQALAVAGATKNIAMSGTNLLNTVHGIWLREGNRFIHIETMMPGIRLEGITEYQIDTEHQLTKARYATEAIFDQGVWQLKNITETSFNQQEVTTQKVAQENWKVKIKPSVFNLSEVKPEEMSLVQLSHFIHFRQANGLSAANYQLVFWRRIGQPVAMLVMILLSIPFIFGPLRTVAMGVRIVVGVAAGFLFYLLNQFFGPIFLFYQFPPILGALLPSLLFSVVGIAFMRFKS